MARAASGSRIAFGSEAWRAGAHQFEANLDRLLAIYRDAGIPVWIGTPVSNEKDRPPFASAAEPEGDTADDWYARGAAALAAGDADAARTAFRNARDRDELPFRATTAFDEIVRRLAAKHGATLVDVQARFAAASQHGIVGHELLLEHVHPNAHGYFLLADAFYDALRDAGAIGDWSRAPSRERAHRDMPITELDRVLGDWAVLELEALPPFRVEAVPFTLPEPRTDVERLARALRDEKIAWVDAMEQLLQRYRRDGRLADAAVVARVAAHAYPTEPAPSRVAGRLYMELGQTVRAQRYLEQSRRARR
jgi:lysophospholipase L1-like esterase